MRAFEHLTTLEEETEEFLEKSPYEITSSFEAEANCYVLRFRVKENLPLRVATIFGDLIHNLRSALDHIASLLACEANSIEDLWKPGVAPQIQFPITRSPGDFTKHRALGYFSARGRAFLEPLQPFEWSGRPDYLISINRYSNVDKHRVVTAGAGAIYLHETAVTPAAIEHEVLFGGATLENTFDRKKTLLVDGVEVARVRFNNGPPSHPAAAKADVTTQPAVKITFRAETQAITVGATRELCGYVQEILELAGAYFAYGDAPHMTHLIDHD